MSDAFWAVAIMAIVTILLRFLPFLVFSGERKKPEIMHYLGKVLPCAIMGMLVVFCLKDTSLRSVSGFLPQLTAGAVTAISYIWKRNSLLSIVLGTVVFMLIV